MTRLGVWLLVATLAALALEIVAIRYGLGP